MIFVFGSNLAGRHGGGAARIAKLRHGAEYGVGVGIQGNSYAIPTKDKELKTLPLHEIETYVKSFQLYCISKANETFYVTAIGTGLAGYSHEQIAPLFLPINENCIYSHNWKQWLGEKAKYHDK